MVEDLSNKIEGISRRITVGNPNKEIMESARNNGRESQQGIMEISKETTEEDRKGIMGTSKRTMEEDRKE